MSTAGLALQDETGRRMYELIEELYPICRSITGDGVRQTLAIIGRRVPLEIHEVPSGTQVFDWTVPREWNVREAFVIDPGGSKIIDFRRNNLHLASYSMPVRARLPLNELKKHLHSIPEYPDWIPYRTTYYTEDWSFCLPHRQLVGLEEGVYEVCIDASLADGSMTYGECYLSGTSSDEVLISCHICHPSLCNDNLSGIAVSVSLAERLAYRPRRHSFRFLFIPGTIGAIAWLHRNQEGAARIRHGLVLTCLGDSGGFNYKKSRRGDAVIDRAVQHVLSHCGEPFEILPFSPYGYDERQFCSPGFNLPVGRLTRSVHSTFPEYHTSADNLNFVKPERLAGSLKVALDVLDVLEGDGVYVNRNPYCEPQLSKRGLYGGIGGTGAGRRMGLLWVLNLSDGNHSLLDIAERSGLPFREIREAADLLLESGLLEAAGQ